MNNQKNHAEEMQQQSTCTPSERNAEKQFAIDTDFKFPDLRELGYEAMEKKKVTVSESTANIIKGLTMLNDICCYLYNIIETRDESAAEAFSDKHIEASDIAREVLHDVILENICHTCGSSTEITI
jgi:hypothetical protein